MRNEAIPTIAYAGDLINSDETLDNRFIAMNVAVFGNSNSIMLLPLVRRLREADTFIEFNIGGSPTPSHLHQLLINSELVKSCCVALIEPVVIDDYAFNSDQILKTLELYVDCFLAELCLRGVAPVLVVLPSRKNTLEGNLKVANIWKVRVDRVGGLVIDTIDFMQRLEPQQHTDLEWFWQDKTHYIEPVRHWIASIIALGLDSVYKDWLAPTFVDNWSSGFIAIDGRILAASNGIESTYRETRIAKADCLRIREQGITLTCPSPEHVVYGIMLNWGLADGAKGAIIEFQCGDQHVQQKVSFWNARGQNLMLQFNVVYWEVFNKFERNKPIKVVLPSCDENAGFFHSNLNDELEIAGVLWGLPHEKITASEHIYRSPQNNSSPLRRINARWRDLYIAGSKHALWITAKLLSVKAESN